MERVFFFQTSRLSPVSPPAGVASAQPMSKQSCAGFRDVPLIKDSFSGSSKQGDAEQSSRGKVKTCTEADNPEELI